jgi:predicted 3-demethylubiquinone-9 3-methyltransferase (glyoxalase superfamily)
LKWCTTTAIGLPQQAFSPSPLNSTARSSSPSTEARCVIRCDSQAEVDNYWEKLSAGGSEGQCGWIKDRFGLFWQIVPARLPDLTKKPNAIQAMLKMKKLDIAELGRAAES